MLCSLALRLLDCLVAVADDLSVVFVAVVVPAVFVLSVVAGCDGVADDVVVIVIVVAFVGCCIDVHTCVC